MFMLTIETDNAAFEDDPTSEVCRLLGTAAGKLANGQTSGKLLDINGNTVGKFSLKSEDDDA